MTPSERVDAIMRELMMSPGSFFLGGSSVLALRDIRHVGDIDMGVTTRYWFELATSGGWKVWTPEPLDDYRRCDPPYLVREVQGTEINVFHGWRWRDHETRFNDFNLAFREGTELVNGWPCVKLSVLLRMKTDAVVNDIQAGMEPRPKDMNDIRHIVDALSADGR